MIAFERVRSEHGITLREFSKMLGISERTFRSWQTRPPAPPRRRRPPPAPPRQRDARRGRFDLDAIPPGVELTADTTDLELFDIPLKLIAAQDPGRRDEELYEAFHLDVVEDARRVVAVVDAATRHRSFAQVVTDRGTPYCAHEAKAAYEARALEHAPTKEGTPTQKAPLERSFGTLKPLLAPLAALTSTLSAMVPALRSQDLAKTVGRYLVSLAIDAYRIGATSRVTRSGAPADHAATAAAAAEWTHRRRENHGSCRGWLERIHEEYRMDGSREEFVRALRHYELEDIEEAERRLRTAACRCQARICDRYFVGILRNVSADGDQRRHRDHQAARDRARRKADARSFEAEQEQLRDDPEYAISRGLRLIAVQWSPAKNELLMGGRGMGYIDLRRGLIDLRNRNGDTAGRDGAELAWRRWLIDSGAGDGMRYAIRRVWDQLIAQLFDNSKRDFTAAAARVIINPPPLQSTPRSPP